MNELEVTVKNNPQYKNESIIEVSCGKVKYAFTTHWKPKQDELNDVVTLFREQLSKPVKSRLKKYKIPKLNNNHIGLLSVLITEGLYTMDELDEAAEENADVIEGAKGRADKAIEISRKCIEELHGFDLIVEVALEGERGYYAATVMGLELFNQFVNTDMQNTDSIN